MEETPAANISGIVFEDLNADGFWQKIQNLEYQIYRLLYGTMLLQLIQVRVILLVFSTLM